MAKKKKRRIKSPHPGVVVQEKKLPTGRTTWRARWRDPDTGKTVYQSLTKLGKTTIESRTAWAINKSKTLLGRVADIESGAPLKTETEFEDAVEDFYDRKSVEIAPRTVVTYREGTDRFVAWVNRTGLRLVEDLTLPMLERFRADLIRERRQTSAVGGTKGQKRRQSRPRSPHTVIRNLAAVRIMLSDWRRLGMLPRLDSDAIADGLRRIKTTSMLPTIMKSPDLRQLLKAAIGHDRAMYALTREEHDGNRKPGTTAKHQPIAPFILTSLLTGARLGAVENLKWKDVDLEEKEIRVLWKTHQERRVDLSVSPSLLTLFSRMRLRAGEGRYVFGGKKPLPRTMTAAAKKRLTKTYGAPEEWTWQMLRRSCGSFLTCAPAIYGAASAFMSARRLGHGVQVAEKNYLGSVKDISPEAKTLEAAMGIEDLVEKIVGPVGGTANKAEVAAG